MRIELREVVRRRGRAIPTPDRTAEVLVALATFTLFALAVADAIPPLVVGVPVLVSFGWRYLAGRRPRDVTHELEATLGADGLHHAGGFVPRSEMRVFEVTRDAVVVKTYGGDRFELRGSTRALAEAKRVTALPRPSAERDAELEALVVRVAEQPKGPTDAYRGSRAVSTETALALATDPFCKPKVRVAALALLDATDAPSVRARIEEALEETANPDVHEALRRVIAGNDTDEKK